MDDQKQLNQTIDEKHKASVFIKIIAWFLIFRGLGGMIMALPFLLVNTIWGSILLLHAIALIIASFGLRYMKKWSLYLLTFFIALSTILIIYSLITSPEEKTANLVDGAIQILILGYLWIKSKKIDKKRLV